MESQRDSFLPADVFDQFYGRITPESRAPIEVGGAIVGVTFRVENEICRVYRGNPRLWGTIQKRLAFGDFDISEKILGEGRLGALAAAELTLEQMDQESFSVNERGPGSPIQQATDVTPSARELNRNPVARKEFESKTCPKKKRVRKKKRSR